MSAPTTRTLLCALSLAVALPFAAMAGGSSSFLPDYMKTPNPMRQSDSWTDFLREETVGAALVLDGEDLMALDAPVQAFDAATVPFTLRQRDDTGMRITNLKIVVDENPMPLAAEFVFGKAMGAVTFESRVRYDVFSNIRAVATLEDGRTFMVGRFVEAAGGCSAAVSRDPVAALATMGQMRLKQFDTSAGQSNEAPGATRDVQLMIRHPNFTGLQVRSGTLDAIDARYIDFIEVKLGDEMLFTMLGGFSISENPSFRFSYIDNGAAEMSVRVVDTEGSEFTETFALRSGT
ncbi:MAG: quinoprotein dehydrogenase-associated SoxYZ-like carrier [Rhodobacteraceae bacterium]|nr:MAG: quinoprotein dehydrogenase-associated SoxYZ-like carrier [Paracoccaceae bacterium]